MVAVFLKQNGRADAVRWVVLGAVLAAGLCFVGGVALRAFERTLPTQKEQEGLESVVAMVAVGFVTYMVVWMRRHARSLKGHLETSAREALARGSVIGFVSMAFLAVLREGFETAVFLLATFQNSSDPQATGTGATLGIACAVVVGFAIYGGGIQLNLSRFFRITGLLLVVVAAGLVSSSLHTAHEAGWLNFGQAEALDLTWLIRPGSVASALVTGMFGIQPRPATIEVIGWFVYLVPVGLYVAWPQRPRQRPPRSTSQPQRPALRAAE